MQLDHLTIRTRDLGAAKVFFEQVPDLFEGEWPAIIRRIPATGCSTAIAARSCISSAPHVVTLGTRPKRSCR